MTKSVGRLDSVDGITGEVLSKTVDLDLTMKDEKPAPYVMTLRQYELQREGPRSVSRWVVTGPQAAFLATFYSTVSPA